MNITSYSCTTLIHAFETMRISYEYKKEIEQLLLEISADINGSFEINAYDFAIYSITYETTDTWEGREEFAEELGNNINLLLGEFAESKGGIANIKI